VEARDLNYVGALSYTKVKRHQFIMHPRDRARRKEFDWVNTDISYLPLYESSIKKSQWVTPAAREMGVGPTLFLMTQKAFCWLFLFFCILNFPLIFFYAKGSGNPENQGAESFDINSLFGMISLGNIGISDYTCANANVGNNEKTFRFNCPYGTMRELSEFGL